VVLAAVVLALAACAAPPLVEQSDAEGSVPQDATDPSPTTPADDGGTAPSSSVEEPSVASAPGEPATPSAVAVPAEPVYEATVSAITPALAERMHASWRPGCPVPLEDLRYVTVAHHTPDGDVATGELVVHADVADGLVDVFRTLFEVGYPVESMRLVDDFGADDDASMAANNTSAFSCRAVTGGSGWSEHSYGRALDLNPVQNPYVRGSAVLPPAGVAYLDRPDEPGVIRAGDAVVEAFATAGWSWGGYWSRPTDYQHFSTTNR